MFGFVCLLLYAALSLQFMCVCVCVCMLCMYCAHAMYLLFVWGKSTKGDKIINRVRVNGSKRLVLIVRN